MQKIRNTLSITLSSPTNEMKNLMSKPNRTIIASFASALSDSDNLEAINTFEEGHYVLHVACASGTNQRSPLSCALSDRSIQSYDRETLKHIHTIKDAHSKRITDLTQSSVASSGDTNDCPLIVSSSEDRLVKIFDLRMKGTQPAVCLGLAKEEALSVSIGYGGSLAAVGGSKGQIHFYDLRNISGSNIYAPLGSYVDAHTEEVTKVRFQNANNGSNDTTSIMVTASEDGLVNIFDTSQPSEELALKSVMNIQSPLREVGFFGPSLEGIFCLTGSETFSVWHYDSAQRIVDFGDMRTMLSANSNIPIHYMIGCHWDGRDLNLLSGNTNGDCAMFKVDVGNISLKQILTGGHKSSIRSFTALNNNVIITGGEDSRMCEWNVNKSNNAPNMSPGISRMATEASVSESNPPQVGGGAIRRHKKKTEHRPY